MRKLAACSAVALAALLLVVTMQPAGAQQAGSLTGLATGTYDTPLPLLPTTGPPIGVHAKGDFAGLNGAGAVAAGTMHCTFDGETVGTIFVEQGHLTGACFGDLLIVGNASNQCTLDYTRVGIQAAVTLSCFFRTSGDNGFMASGAGTFTGVLTSFNSFALVGTGLGV